MLVTVCVCVCVCVQTVEDEIKCHYFALTLSRSWMISLAKICLILVVTPWARTASLLSVFVRLLTTLLHF